MNAGAKGTLHLIPVTLGDDSARAGLAQATLELVNALDYFIVENEKARAGFLKALHIRRRCSNCRSSGSTKRAMPRALFSFSTMK